MLENPSALALLLILLPIIVLYILKPKPRIIKIPSLMLLFSIRDRRKLRSLFEKLVRDPLLLLQLLIVIIIVLSLANPYFTQSARPGLTVIVLDNSASMAATDVSPDRFSVALDTAKELIAKSDRTSVILAGSTPILLFKDAGRQKALGMLAQLKPKASGSDLNSALMLAADLAENEKGKIVIISDFSAADISWGSKMIEGKNIPVEYRQVGTGGRNVGFVDAAIEGNDLKFIVKNYNKFPVDASIKVSNSKGTQSISRILEAESKEFFHVSNISGGTTHLLLEPEDILSIDNHLFISLPPQKNNRVLLLGDLANGKSPLSIAFASIPDVTVEELSFERAPRKLDYNLVVIHDYTRNSLLPGTLDDLQNYVEEGGTLVIEASNDLQFMELKKLLPVNVSGLAKPARLSGKNDELTNGIDFGFSGYLKSRLKEGAVGLASGEEGPILAYRNAGKGKVIYVGINKKWGDFHLQNSYPIFWFKLLEFASPAKENNYKAGTLLSLGTPTHVDGPRSSIETGSLYLDETGFYKIGDKIIASNLLDEKESDISVNKIDSILQETKPGENIERIHLNILLSILALILLAYELYYLRNRGEI